MRPDLLIVEGGKALTSNLKRREREGTLIGTLLKLVSLTSDTVTATLESSHSVLMPCDASPRLLELLVLLDQHWTFKKTEAQSNQRHSGPWEYPLCLVSSTASDMLSFARSLMEWMGGVVRENGSEEVVGMDKRKKGRKRAAQAMGSEYGALGLT